MAKFFIGPIGEFIHPWVNKPDTKFNADGLFQTGHIVSGPEAEELADKIEAASKTALAEHIDGMKPGEAKKWNLYLPFERLEDDEGEPTGQIQFNYKQNAKITKKNKEVVDVRINIVDADAEPTDALVFNGAEGRVSFSMRPIVMSSAREVGVRLDFAGVQVTKLAPRKSSSGFGKVEGGFKGNRGDSSEDDDEFQPSSDSQDFKPQADETEGDY